MNENNILITAVLVVVTLCLYINMRGKVPHSEWCAYVLSWGGNDAGPRVTMKKIK